MTSARPRRWVGFAGAVSGGAQVLAEHPLDTLKVRMQSKNPGSRGREKDEL